MLKDAENSPKVHTIRNESIMIFEQKFYLNKEIDGLYKEFSIFPFSMDNWNIGPQEIDYSKMDLQEDVDFEPIPDSAPHRIRKEIKKLVADPINGISIQRAQGAEDNYRDYDVRLAGPQNSTYEGGLFDC